MRHFLLSLIALIAAASAASGETKSSSGIQGAFGSPGSASGSLRGVYGPPDSSAGHMRGVYSPPQSPSATPLTSTLAGSASSSSDAIPSVTLPGTAETGQSLPEGVTPSPMPDRPGYGRATVNGRPAIIDTNDNRIVEFSD